LEIYYKMLKLIGVKNVSIKACHFDYLIIYVLKLNSDLYNFMINYIFT